MQAAFETTYSFDTSGQVTASTGPATTAAPHGMTSSYTYDASGNQLTATDPNGVTTTSSYNPVGLVATTTYSGSAAHSVSYGYDADGNVTATTDGTGSSSYSYDPFDELTSATNGAGRTVGYGYNADGATSSITYPLPAGATWAASDSVSYGYDQAGYPTSVTDFNGNKITIGNTADGLANSEVLAATGDTLATTYDNTGVASEIDLKNAASTLLSFSYSDAPSGAILSETDTPSSPQTPASYTYDQLGRVTSMTPGSGSPHNYAFDAAGNLTTTPTGATGTYDDAGELTSSVLGTTTTNFAYDAKGQRLTAKVGTTTNSSGTWDGAGNLTSYSDPAAAMTAASYDAGGLRASDTIGGTGQSFTWDNASHLLMDGSNAYIYAGGTAPAEQVSLATGQVSYLATDSLGSVRGVVASNGSLTASTSYDAWGNPQTAGGLSSYTPFGYAGGYTDSTGLIYLTARYYDPATGQFLSVDPAVTQTGQPYTYAAGNPVSESDPSGQWAVGLWSGIPFPHEKVFQTWLFTVLGGPTINTWEFRIHWLKGTPTYVSRYGDRRVDIYSYANFGWLNETKTGKTNKTSGRTGTQGEVLRDYYLVRSHGNTACHEGSPCTSFSVLGAIWWFSYKGTTGCQTLATLKSKTALCPSAGLINDMNRHKINQVYVFYPPRRFRKEVKRYYQHARVRAAIQAAVESTTCPDKALQKIAQIIPNWKFPSFPSCKT